MKRILVVILPLLRAIPILVLSFPAFQCLYQLYHWRVILGMCPQISYPRITPSNHRIHETDDFPSSPCSLFLQSRQLACPCKPHLRVTIQLVDRHDDDRFRRYGSVRLWRTGEEYAGSRTWHRLNWSFHPWTSSILYHTDGQYYPMA